MRLIDADKLSNKSCPMGKKKYCSNCGEKRAIKNPYTDQSISCDDIRFDFLQLIDREKTVEAIPIEWIKAQLEKKEYRKLLIDYIEWSSCLEWLLEKWEEENEIDRC